MENTLTWGHAGDILVRLSCAFALGAFVAHRPWRRLVGRRAPRLQTDTAQTQSIIAVAGALLVVVIGDSLARAFGLVGLGTFIRFRAGVKDPRDVAILFVMIGVGMACGLGLVGTAAVGTLFVSAVLALFDRFAPPRRRTLTISVVAPDPAAVQPGPPPTPAQKPRSGVYQVLAIGTGVLLVMMVAATVVAAVRNRTKLPPVVVSGAPAGVAGPAAAPLAVAAERGLAEVSNLGLAPREAIIACYAAMENGLADRPGVAPQVSDTPSEVLARAVVNGAISPGSASTLVGLFTEARFSSHVMTEAHREEAEQALRSVLGQLRSSA